MNQTSNVVVERFDTVVSPRVQLTLLLEFENFDLLLSGLVLFITSDMYVFHSHMIDCKLTQAQISLEWNSTSTDDENLTGVKASTFIMSNLHGPIALWDIVSVQC